MKDKAIIALILIVAMALSVTIALADNVDFGTFVNAPGWDVINGNSEALSAPPAEYIRYRSDSASDAAHALPASNDGNFDLTIPFMLNGNGTISIVGLSTASSAQDSSGWTVIGNGPDIVLRLAMAAWRI